MNDQTLLLVDDEEGIRRVLGISLADEGYDVHTAASGEEALEVFRRVTPRIVLTDIKMPGMDGIELLKRIKQENADTEVIMITGHGDMDLAIESLKYEAVDFVTKPIRDEVLEIALKRAHDKIDTRRQLREYTENLEALVAEKSARLLEAERQLAVGQAVEGIATAMRDLAGDLQNGITYFNEMPCFVSIHNRDQKIVAVNQLYSDRLGNRVGQASDSIYPPSPLPEHDEEVKNDKNVVDETFRSGRGQRRNATVVYDDGRLEPVVVHTAPIRNREGEVELVVEIAVDITEVKRLQDELRHTRQRYEQLFDIVPCYISVQDRDFRLTATNRRFQEDFGKEGGSHCYEVYKHRREPCPNCPVTKTFEDGQSHQAEMVVTSRSGEQINVLVWTAPIYNALGEVTQVMEVSTNITQIRKLQDHLSTLGLKISSISHGIKGLLAGLDGGMYLLNTGFDKESQGRIQEGWEVVQTIVGRIRKLVLDILYFAKERELRLKRVDVLSFARDVAATVAPKLSLAGINFIRDFDDALGKFEVDVSVLRSGLINILENAVEACMDDSAKSAHEVRFAVTQSEDQFQFTVSDTGIGMNRETRENLFTLFFSSKGNKGTGLGLFITHETIAKHGGTIVVDSEPGKGARFVITVPKQIPEVVKTPPTPEEMLFCGVDAVD